MSTPVTTSAATAPPLRRELRGDLKDVALATILMTVKERKLTGELMFSRGTDQVGLQLANGEILFAHSNDPATRLGEWLLMKGKITVAQYEESVRVMKETRARQGTVLLQLGYIEPIELERAVKMQVSDIVFGLFNWSSGEYRFTPQEPTGELITLEIGITELILKGIGQMQNWPLVERSLKPFSDVYEINRDFDLVEARRVKLTRDEDSILHLVDGRSTIEELVARSPYSPYATLRGLYAFKAVRVLRKKAV